MKIWMLVTAVLVVLLIVVGTVMAIMNAGDSEEDFDKQNCPSYNTCSQEDNCGRATCGAIQGKSCGCRG